MIQPPAMQLQDLPPEIFFRIFSYLPAPDLASNVSRVCTYWRSFSTDECIWKCHSLERWGYLQRTQSQADKLKLTWLSYFKSNFDKTSLSFLVLGAEGGGAYNERLLDVQQKLKSGGLVNVETLNVRNVDPTLEYLRGFNAVMFFSYHGFNQIALGNVLAAYVDMGGGVVVCAYSNCGKGNRLEGKWGNGKYDPLSLGSTSRCPNLRIGRVRNPKHPIMKGVNVFDGGEQSSHGDGHPHPQAETIAEWNNGRPLVVELSEHAGTIVAVNMYPPSGDVATGGWDPATHGGLLLANALHYVATKT